MPSTRRFLVLAGAALALALAGLPAQAADIPAPGEIVMSPNIEHVTNVPKPEALADINTDMAFQGDYAYVGNYHGFSIYDIRNPKRARVVSSVVCPGGQMDVSVYGDLLFGSVDSSRSDDSCGSTGQSASVKESWEGVRIFDIRDKRNPRYIKSVETSCGSHTHTLVPDRRGKNVYLYVSSYSPNAAFPDCRPPHDLISIIKVPLRNPRAASVIATPNLFPDGGFPGVPGPFPDGKSATTGCHDITAYPEKGIAAGACGPTRGANAYYDIVRDRMVFRGYFKIPRHQSDTENCVAHNGSLIPVKGKDIMVQAWYQGGISVVDFTDPGDVQEIAYFERGPDTTPLFGGHWSAYYYNGHIYGSDFHQGLDVLKLNDRRTNQANGVKFDILNAQTQQSYPDRRHH
ncbi:MAG TPA: hypothetical protein VKZ82_19885 [Nonomuraea sp.]|nr:hypothetical protein [Nonomuraea sp.]